MRAVQAVALELFERRGFDQVTIEEIARRAGVGVATVYRHFGTKERLVLWDEYDPQLVAELATRLPAIPPLEALRQSVAAGLEQVYAEGAARILRRGQLIRANPALQLASAWEMVVLRRALAEVVRASGSAEDPLDAEVIAGALVATLEAAIWRFIDDGGKTSLRRAIGLALRRLERLGVKG